MFVKGEKREDEERELISASERVGRVRIGQALLAWHVSTIHRDKDPPRLSSTESNH